METYRSGHNGADSKSVCGQPHVGSNPTVSAKNRQVSTCRFFIHCESNGISSRVSVCLVTEGAYHQPKAVFAFAMMIYNGKPLMIYNSFGIDDIHAFGVIWHDGLEISPILCYTNIRKTVGI